MRKTAKLLSIILIFAFVLNLCPFAVSAENYVAITENTTAAMVVQIIDGDAVKVVLKNGDVALVKLLGISSQGYNNAAEYLTDKILGTNVTLVKDSSVRTPVGIWNYMYVIYAGLNISSDLVSKGYASVDASQAGSSFYSNLTNAQTASKASGMGLWGEGANAESTVSSYLGTTRSTLLAGKVNINTATVSQLKEKLNNISNSQAEKIVKYRSNNAFNSIEEFVFVEGMSNSLFKENKNIIVVSTNINKAEKEELETLSNLSDNEIDDIIAYRKKRNFSDIADLRKEKIVSADKYNKIEDFIATDDTGSVYFFVNGNSYNLNTAAVYQFSNVGVTSSNANKIIAARANGYTFKTLMEITKIPDIQISVEDANYLEDNLHPLTDVNTAKTSELSSIFGTENANKLSRASWMTDISKVSDIVGIDVYNKYKDLIYCGKNSNTYINLNTATAEQLKEIGFKAESANLIASHIFMKTGMDIPVNVSALNNKITLYTNINTATEAELRSLNNGINDTIVNEIIKFRTEQPFGNMTDIKELFARLNASVVYNNISDYIVVR